MSDAPVGAVDDSDDVAGRAQPDEAEPEEAEPEEAEPDEADGEDVGEDVDEPGARATDVLEYVVKALVDEPDAVDIDVLEDRRGLRMQVSVAPGDMGRVIGRRGRMANAIRTVVRAAAVNDGLPVDVDFVD